MAQLLKIKIYQASPSDIQAVAAFAQPIYAATYPNEKYGLKPEHFSPAVFRTPDTLDYFAKIMINSDRQLALIAATDTGIVGTISIERLDDCYEVHAFYVAIQLQGHGIGRQLLHEALGFVTDDLPVRVEVAETNTKAIQLYRHLGFKLAPELGDKLRHWPEWPAGIQNRYIYMQARKAAIK